MPCISCLHCSAFLLRAGLRRFPGAIPPQRHRYPVRCCRGLVASFAGAPGVSLTRCAAQLRLPHEFEAMLRAVALGESDRWVVQKGRQGGAGRGGSRACNGSLRCPTGAWRCPAVASAARLAAHLSGASIELRHCVHIATVYISPLCTCRHRLHIATVSSPLCRPASGVPISHLSLSRCPHGDDATVATICDTFAGLTRLDMSRCTEVGDGGVQRLAAYTRVAPSEGSGSSSGGDNGSEDEAGWVASGSGGGGADAPAAAAAAGVESMQLTPRGGGLLAPAQGAPVPGLESPSSAVQRIAEERHAAMMARSAAAGATLCTLAVPHACPRRRARHVQPASSLLPCQRLGLSSRRQHRNAHTLYPTLASRAPTHPPTHYNCLQLGSSTASRWREAWRSCA